MLDNRQFGRRLCVAVDACSYGRRHDRRQAELQDDLLRILDIAARAAGLTRAGWSRQPSGDGEMAVLPLDEPDALVVDDYVRHLDDRLARFNEVRYPEHRLRLRLATHFGPAEPAANGFAGSGPVITGRLLDSAPAREVMLREPAVNLVVIVSDRVFEETISAGHTGLRTGDFVRVPAQVKELETYAWIRALGLTPERLADLVTGRIGQEARADGGSTVLQAARDLHAPSHDHSGPTYVSRVDFHAPVEAPGSVFGMSFGGPRPGSDG